MKRGAPKHKKMHRLAAELGMPRPYAVGLMEGLWQWVGEYAPTGLLRPDDAAVMAKEIGFTGKVEKLWKALVEARWLDPCGNGAAVVHDWREHCEDSVHRRLARAREYFADGSRPSTHRLEKDEREAIVQDYERLEAEAGARRAHEMRPSLAMPSPAQPLPPPTPSHSRETGVSHGVENENREKVRENKNQTPKTQRVDERTLRERIRRDDFAAPNSQINAEVLAEFERLASDEAAPYSVREKARRSVEQYRLATKKPPAAEQKTAKTGAAHG